MQPIHYILALLAGMLMPIQSAINHKLSTYVQTPVVSAFISFIIGGIALLIFLIISGTPISLSGAKNAPLITWAGGICGAFFVTIVVMVVPRLGMALTFGILILGQMITTLPIDHFGFLETPVKQINFQRVLGVILVIAGAFLIRKF